MSLTNKELAAAIAALNMARAAKMVKHDADDASVQPAPLSPAWCAEVDAEIDADVQPVAWVRIHPDGTLTTEFHPDALITGARRTCGAWLPLYVAPIAPAPAATDAPSHDVLIDVITKHLYNTYHCTRVWNAWQVGTMNQDDFEPVDESNTPAKIADALLALFAAPPVDAKPQAHLMALLTKAKELVAELGEDNGYGFYRPENPHDFFPDCENSPDEIAAHKAACEAWDKGEYVRGAESGWVSENVHVTVAPWGPGAYTLRDPRAQAFIDEIDKILPIPATLPASAVAIGALHDPASLEQGAGE